MKYLAPFLVFLLLLGGAAPSFAQDYRRARQGVQNGEMQSLDQILPNVRRQIPGRLLDVEGLDGGRYRLKWLTPDGRVLGLETDARTGRIVGQGDRGGPPEGYQGGPPREYQERPPRPDPRSFRNNRNQDSGPPPGYNEGGNGNGRGRFGRVPNDQFQGNNFRNDESGSPRGRGRYRNRDRGED